jgi:hypothetical protein
MVPITSQPNGNQLLPVVLENRARLNPHGAWAKFPVSDHTYASGLRTATNLEVSNAVNKLAWLLEEDWVEAESSKPLHILASLISDILSLSLQLLKWATK